MKCLFEDSKYTRAQSWSHLLSTFQLKGFLESEQFSQDGCLVTWLSRHLLRKNKILMIFFYYCLGESHSAFSQSSHIGPSSTLSAFASGAFHPPERTLLSCSYSVSKSYSVSTVATLPRKERWKASVWLPWGVLPQWKIEKEVWTQVGKQPWVLREPWRHGALFVVVFKQSCLFTTSWTFRASHSLQMIDIPTGALCRHL